MYVTVQSHIMILVRTVLNRMISILNVIWVHNRRTGADLQDLASLDSLKTGYAVFEI